MFNFFKRIFKKKSTIREIAPISENQSISVDIKKDRITINQSAFSLPIDIKDLTIILGEPRVQQFETNAKDKEFLENFHSGAPVTNRANYMWDNLGIKCYTSDGVTVHTFGVELNEGFLKYPHIPQRKFEGSLTIEGEPWLPKINGGEDCDEIIREMYVGNYLVTAEYVDFDSIENVPTEKDYTGIEIQKK